MHRERENPHKRFVASKNRKTEEEEEDAHSCQPRENCTQKKKKKDEQTNAQNKQKKISLNISWLVFFFPQLTKSRRYSTESN